MFPGSKVTKQFSVFILHSILNYFYLQISIQVSFDESLSTIVIGNEQVHTVATSLEETQFSKDISQRRI